MFSPIAPRKPDDAMGLVPYYTEPSEVPAELQKYFSKRYQYFSRYSEGCLLDGVGWFSVTPESVADRIAARCSPGKFSVVLDAFCGVGGNAIAFARHCKRVIALDISATRLALAHHNARIYAVENKIEFLQADFVSFAQSYSMMASSPNGSMIDVVFLDPPWNGPAFRAGIPVTDEILVSRQAACTDNGEQPKYALDRIVPLSGAQLFQLARGITKNVAFHLPKDTDRDEIFALVDNDERTRIDEEFIEGKMVAITCYFGGLVI